MIVDSSAVVGILLREPDWEGLLARLDAADAAAIGAPTMVETGLVLTSRLGVQGKTLLARFIQESSLEVVPMTADHWTVAVDAFVRFGKGRHPAALNFGDCLTYAIAQLAQEPLLCKGDDFPRTDLVLAGA